VPAIHGPDEVTTKQGAGVWFRVHRVAPAPSFKMKPPMETITIRSRCHNFRKPWVPEIGSPAYLRANNEEEAFHILSWKESMELASQRPGATGPDTIIDQRVPEVTTAKDRDERARLDLNYLKTLEEMRLPREVRSGHYVKPLNWTAEERKALRLFRNEYAGIEETSVSAMYSGAINGGRKVPKKGKAA